MSREGPVYLNGFRLTGCWQELAINQRKARTDSENKDRNKRRYPKRKLKGPEAWEFTDYDESMVDCKGRIRKWEK